MLTLRTARILILVYMLLSIVSTVILMSERQSIETYVHSEFLAVMSIVFFLLAHHMAKGNEKSLLRVRIIIAILFPALLITSFVLPIPTWYRIEHVLVAMVLALIAIIIFQKHPIK